MSRRVREIDALTAAVTAFAQGRGEPDDAAIGQHVARLTLERHSWTQDELVAMQTLLTCAATAEPVWGLLAGLCCWANGRQEATDFYNVWNCAKYAGLQSRFSKRSPQHHLEVARALSPEVPTPAPYLIAGNALRQLHRYAEAESAYLQGLAANPEDPFLKFRLVDLWLMTYQPERAVRMLASLRSRYPYALEMLFALPVAEGAMGPDNQLPALDPGGAQSVWLVAADPEYLRRYGERLARSIAGAIPGVVQKKDLLLHVHVLRDPGTPVPARTLDAMAALVPVQVTQRTLDLSGVTPTQRATLFACERFLFLGEILAKYDRPTLITDIDLECLRDPRPIFAAMGQADILHTRFSVCIEAWDRYPATVLLARPTPEAILFFKRLSGLLITLLQSHPHPWFADQVGLFRLIEGGLTPARFAFRGQLLTDTDSPQACFRLLHGSWASG